MPIRLKISVMMLSLLIIPLIITGYISYKNSEALEYAIIEKEDFEKMSPSFGKIFASYDQFLVDLTVEPELQYDVYAYPKSNSGSNFGNMPVANDDDKTAFFEKYLMEFQEQHQFLLNVYVATEDDAFYVSNIPPQNVDLSGESMSKREWYVAAVASKGDVIWTEPYRDTGSGKSTITVARALTDASGAVIGVVGFDFDMHELAVMLRGNTLRVTIITGVIALVVGAVLVYLFATAVSRNILLVRNQLNKISQGKLDNAEVYVKSKDEINELATALNMMQRNLRGIIEEVELASEQVAVQSGSLTRTADEINTGATQIAQTLEELAVGAETQANSASDVSATMHQFNADINRANEQAEKVSQISGRVISITKEGNESMNASKGQMEHIESVVQEAVEKVQGLDYQAREIATLISVIQDIADQTNLLALNAAIEAARAGEQGKGFAVVANEVRKLAEQVSGSVGHITRNITNIQQVSSAVAESLESGYGAVQRGSEQINITGNVFSEIDQAISQMVSGMNEVANGLGEITSSSNKVNREVENIAAISEQSAAGIEETYASSEQSSDSMGTVVESSRQLADLSIKLQKTVEHFKL